MLPEGELALQWGNQGDGELNADQASEYHSDEEEHIANYLPCENDNMLVKDETVASVSQNQAQPQECRRSVNLATYKQAMDAEMTHINEQVEENLVNGVEKVVPETDAEKQDCAEQLKGGIMNTNDTDDEWRVHRNKKGVRTRTMPFT